MEGQLYLGVIHSYMVTEATENEWNNPGIMWTAEENEKKIHTGEN